MAVAMVTASHNENGWTGVKDGYRRKGLTHAAEEMKRTKRYNSESIKSLLTGKGK